MRCTLGDVAKIKHGYAFKGEYFTDNPTEYLLVTPGNFSIGGGFRDKPKYYSGPIPEAYVLKQNDLIVTMTDLSKQGDTLGYSALVPRENRYLHNQRIGLVSIINPNALKEYVYWIMQTHEYQRYIVNRASGSTVKHTSPSSILMYEFDLPPVSTQQEIANTLFVLDARIAENRKINHHLEQMAQAIFKSWFVDFEPFGGVMPDDWQEAELGDVALLSAGGDKPAICSPTPIDECTIPIFSNGIDNFGLYGYTDKPKITDESVTVSARGTIGYVCLRQDPFVPIVRLVTAIPNSNFITAKYLYLYLSSIHIDGVGTTQQQLTVPDFKKYRILVPSLNIVENFTRTVDPMLEAIRHKRAENINLAKTRDALLPKLISGELSVADI